VRRGDEGMRRTLAGQEDQAFNGKKIQTKRLTLAAEAGFGSKMSRMSTVDDGQKGNEFKWGLVTKQVQYHPPTILTYQTCSLCFVGSPVPLQPCE
jgi:hypothetical protein